MSYSKLMRTYPKLWRQLPIELSDFETKNSVTLYLFNSVTLQLCKCLTV